MMFFWGQPARMRINPISYDMMYSVKKAQTRRGKGVCRSVLASKSVRVAEAMKGEARNYSSDSSVSNSSSSDSESTSTSSSSGSRSSSSISVSTSSVCKSKRKRKHTSNIKRSKHNHKSKTDYHRNVKFKRSGSFREDTTEQKPRKHARRFAVKSQCELDISEDEERIYKRKRKEKEKRQRNKHRKQKKGEIKQQTEAPLENVIVAGKRNSENAAFQVLADAKEQQKAIIQRNAELAKARLASGELQRARNEQMKMQDLYGFVDWRAKKKLRKEKRVLERTVATGKKLASLDERETARMDAFRIAVGLPTAEAQRQAEWRAHATESLAELSKGHELAKSTSRHSKVIGPLPRI